MGIVNNLILESKFELKVSELWLDFYRRHFRFVNRPTPFCKNKRINKPVSICEKYLFAKLHLLKVNFRPKAKLKVKLPF